MLFQDIYYSNNPASPLFVVSEVLCISPFSVCTIIELGQLGRGLPFVDDQILDGAINSISVDI